MRQFYKPWDLRPEEEDQIKQQTEHAEQSISTELEERGVNGQNGAEEHKIEEEVHHSEASAAKGDGAEATKPFESPEEWTEREGKSKAELAGADTTNEAQIVTEQNQTGHDNTNNEDKPDFQATGQDVERGKQEEKLHEDHGGEELVEGQEDDVIY